MTPNRQEASQQQQGAAPSQGQSIPPDLNELLEFLYGAAQLDGKWYGDLPPEGKPRYWWRSKLREAVKRAFGVDLPDGAKNG